jgi:class 3 adenylate cyclase
MNYAGRSGSKLSGGETDTEHTGEVTLVDMGHDLITPTSTITAYTEILLDSVKKEPEFEVFMPDINKMLVAGEQLSNLVNRLFSQKDSRYEVEVQAFTSTIRHDLRTPINAIIGYGEMLLEDIDAESHQTVCANLQKIITAARRLLTLIGDLTYLLKSEPERKEQKKEQKPEAFPVPTLMDEVVRTMRTVEHQVDLAIQDASLLVVDDKEDNRDLLSRRLDRQGFRVAVAESGLQALQMTRYQSYDLILLDIIMPEMDGYQVLAALKADEMLRHIPVIMISALDEIDSVVRCIEMGAEDYLQKPFNQVILKAKISASLERKRLRDREHAFIKKLQAEQEKSEKLLLNILPKPIADRLKKGARTIADHFPDVTVLFSDLVGFTKLSTHITASELVEKLNEIFLAFDMLAESHGLEKIKTIGDAYMLVGGLPMPRADHVEAVADMAIDMVKAIKRLNIGNNNNFQIRVGIHTGPVVAGVIGKNKFNYDLWGDTVNTASRMESQGISGSIQISETTYQRIKDKFIFEQRGPIEVKGKGEMVTYLLKERR